MQNQAYIFFIFILNGFIIGIVFDFFRILRKSFVTKDAVTYIEDILFWIISASITLYSIFKFNNGELRSFIFLGIVLGLSIYILCFSKIFITICVKAILFIKALVKKVIIVPIIKLYEFTTKYLFKPFILIFINLRKLFPKLKKSRILLSSKKKSKTKKDFPNVC